MPTRLSAAVVACARRDIAGGHATIHEYAERLGVTWGTVANAVYGYTWRSVTDPPPLDPPPAGPEDRPQPSYARLTVAIVAAMRREYRAGTVSHGALARRHGVAEATVRNAVLGYTWRHVREAPVERADEGGYTVLSEKDEREIIRRRGKGETFRDIARALGRDVAVIYRAHQRLSRAGRAARE